MNYALVFGGIALAAILFIENAVIGGGTTYIFLWHSNAGTLVLVSLFIGILIGFGLKSFMTDKSSTEDEDF
ncbi:MAG: hypothetical protein Q8K30_00185 [Candidatus Gracilibacteria bacterium]|nr:hypothetical protein [Candidatus Gracilibacteria bacterium]